VSGIDRHHEDWEQLAELDPMWAILSTPEHRFGNWDQDEFLATGERELADLLTRIDALGGLNGRTAALDFGCGVGRVSRAFAGHFERVVGVDISETMLAQGRDINADVDNLEFVHNTASDLRVLGDRRFDLVYSSIVLQHQPSREIARGYVEDMVRLLAPGGWLVFQIPLDIDRRYRLHLTRRAYKAMRALGFSPNTLYQRFKLHPISMLSVPESELRRWLSDVDVVAVDHVRTGAAVSGTVFAVAPGAAD
jgi:ubiquinone/menaquinone biosynthesis C-methylase UbiE